MRLVQSVPTMGHHWSMVRFLTVINGLLACSGVKSKKIFLHKERHKDSNERDNSGLSPYVVCAVGEINCDLSPNAVQLYGMQ